MGVIKEMGTINRIINIVVLLLAIAAVVFAVQLKDKTAKVVANHKTLSDVIRTVAAELAKGSGSEYAADKIAVISHKTDGWQSVLNP